MSFEHRNRYVVPDRQLPEIEYCIENLAVHTVPLIPKPTGALSPIRDQTIYLFFRTHIRPVRLYLGYSLCGLTRIEGQRNCRKWASHVSSVELYGYLYEDTLRLLETRLLRMGPTTFPGVLWHNERGLTAKRPDPWCCPLLDELATKIFEIFSDLLPMAAFEASQEYPVTHVLGGPMEEVYGLLSVKGKERIMLLKGSRITSRAPNITTLKKVGGYSPKWGIGQYNIGQLEWRPGTLWRPAGLWVTEPVELQSEDEAASFLTLDDPFSKWRWKAV